MTRSVVEVTKKSVEKSASDLRFAEDVAKVKKWVFTADKGRDSRSRVVKGNTPIDTRITDSDAADLKSVGPEINFNETATSGRGQMRKL